MLKLLISIFLLFLSSSTSLAFERPNFLTVSHPVRGPESWPSIKQSPLDLPDFQYHEATKSGTPVTWLLRYDALSDASISAYFQKVDTQNPTHEIGAFLEITPLLAKAAGVEYPQGISIFNANRVFLSGYSPSDRLKLIDTYMTLFQSKFNHHPTAVSAWHLDAFSLKYLRNKYSILAAMICDDQYSTDNYRLWGGYLGAPYTPSSTNILVPSQNENDRIDIMVVRWAQRDLYNFYGPHAESIFSVQVNDYLAAKQSTSYFSKLLDQYSQNQLNEFNHIQIGLENDYSLVQYAFEIKQANGVLKEKINSKQLTPTTLSKLANFVLNRYPQAAPTFLYQFPDITGREAGQKIWFQNPQYRIGIKTASTNSEIIDLRIYNPKIAEENYQTANLSNLLTLEIPAAIDTVKYQNSGIRLPINLNTATKEVVGVRVTYTDGNKKISFTPYQIILTNLSITANIEGLVSKRVGNQQILSVAPNTPYVPSTSGLYLLLAIFIPAILATFYFNKPLSLGLLVAGLTTLTMVRSGNLYPFGLGIWGPNGHDAIFHLSLINSFIDNPLSLNHPQISGSILTSYHFLFDYLSALLCKLFSIRADIMLFQIYPISFALIETLLLEQLFRLWKMKSVEKALAYIFVFLGGSLGFIPQILIKGDFFGGESVFWMNQSVSWLLNPPFALSIILLTLLLILIEKPMSSLMRIISVSIIGGLLAQAKIYSFILFTLALFVSGQFLMSVLVGVLGVILVLPFSKGAGMPFMFEPLWFVQSLFASHDRLYWPKLAEAWAAYSAQNNLVKLFAVNLLAIATYIVGNFATRLFSLLYFAKNLKPSKSEKIAIFIIVLGILTPLLFIQKINPWNTIQFSYYSLFFLGIFAGRGVALFIKGKRPLVSFVILISIFLPTLFTSYATLREYLTPNSSSRISYTELRALEYLSHQPKGIVLSAYFLPFMNHVPEPKNLYGYVSTAYISAFTGQPEFLSDTINLDITGFSYTDRANNIQKLMNTLDPIWGKYFLTSNNIQYLYQTPFFTLNLHPDQLCLKKIFDSGEVNIYKYNCYGQD